MEIRLDRARRKRLFGGGQIYTLILTDAGLYVIHTGSRTALYHLIHTGDLAHSAVTSLLANEARIVETSLKELLEKRPSSFYLPTPEIHHATLKDDEEGRPETLHLLTGEGDFLFDVTLVPAARVRALVEALQTPPDPALDVE